ncbi:MAG: hypothetical protein IKQ20_03660 [Bacteroidales bacterium]|nr:hypothetical protein [Bacteroidales bacterium]
MDGQAQRYGSPRIRIGPPRYRHVDSHLRSVDIQPGVMGNHSRVLGLHVCLMDGHAPGMDSHVPAVGNHATRMDGHTCTLDGHAHCLETHARLCGCPRRKGGRSRNSRGHPRHASSCLVWAWGWTAKTHALGNHNVWPRHRVGLPRNCGHLQLWASTRTSRCLVGVQAIGPGQTWGYVADLTRLVGIQRLATRCVMGSHVVGVATNLHVRCVVGEWTRCVACGCGRV